MSNLDICNEIIPPEEQAAILAAAVYEHKGFVFAAANARSKGGYGTPEPPCLRRPPHGSYPEPEDYQGA